MNNNAIFTNLGAEELENINGGVSIPWKLIGKCTVRALTGAAGVATGAGATIAAGILIYEACDALGVF